MGRTPSSKRRDPSVPRGRPREFDVAVASEAVGRVFWERGYHASSLDDLCQATGLLRGSLYGVFGDKHGMLLAALDQYAEGALARLAERLNPDLPPRDALRTALLHHTKIMSTLTGIRGCLITNTALEMLPADAEVAARIEAIMRRISSMFATAVTRGQSTGAFAKDLKVEEVGDFLLCITQGLRVLGKVGDDEAQLAAVVELALRALR